jgi:hypothetical protein
LVITKFLASIQDVSRVESKSCIGLEKFFRNDAGTAWLIGLLFLIVGVVTIL